MCATRRARRAGRLLLVKCRSEDWATASIAPPLGLASLAAVARERCGWDVRLLDTYLVRDDGAAVARALAETEPDLVGLSAISCEHRALQQIARLVRERAPGVPLVAGGAHPSAYPAQTLADGTVDAVVIGEGEATLGEILERVTAGEGLDGVDGTAVRAPHGRAGNGGVEPATVTIRDPRGAIDPLDSLPMPAWDLLDIDGYASRPGMGVTGYRRYMAVSTSRGCPQRCVYCHQLHGAAFRPHSPGYVREMLATLRERHGVRHLDVVDDNFGLDPERMRAIVSALPPGTRFALPNGLRGDRLENADIEQLWRAGCEHVCLAVETASPRLQRAIGKGIDLDRVALAIEGFARRRVFTAGFFMLGFPDETEAEMRATVDFATRSPLHVAFFYTVIPFGGTALYETVRDRVGDRMFDSDRPYFDEAFNLAGIPPGRFRALKRAAYLRFYGDPRRVGRIVRDVPRRNALVRNLGRVWRHARVR